MMLRLWSVLGCRKAARLGLVVAVILALTGPLTLETASPAAKAAVNPVVLNFDSVSVPVGQCVDATAYLKSFGISFAVSFGGSGTPTICNDTGICCAIATSPPNFFDVTNNQAEITYSLIFSSPVSNISFYRTGFYSGSTTPAWTATAFNAQGQQVGTSVGEGYQLGAPPKLFTITGSGITKLTIASMSDFTTTNNPPIDGLTFTQSTSATQLAFIQQPSAAATVGQLFSVQPQVAVEDSNGNTVTSDTSAVTLSVGAGSNGSGKLTCTGGLSQAAVNGVASFTGCQFDAAGTYILQASDNSFTPVDSNNVAANCDMVESFNPAMVQVSANPPSSSDGIPTRMSADFTPQIAGHLVSLAQAAQICGFQGFDFQQFITQLPGPSDAYTVDPPHDCSGNPCRGPDPVVIPPDPSQLDPPSGGWQYCFAPPKNALDVISEANCQVAATQGAFYYYAPWIEDCVNGKTSDPPPGFCGIVQPNQGNVLHFEDRPADACLPGGAGRNAPGAPCQGPTTTVGNYQAFTTALVGICGDAPAPVCASPGDPSAPLYQWGWISSFNGDIENSGNTGGIIGFYTIPSNFGLVAPVSGTGGVTTTNLNGVPQTPPSVSCSATPSILWPPNGKSVVVTVSGTITPGTQGIPPGGTTYAATDEYGQVQPSGSIALGAGGSYSFGVPLVASRDGTDKDGRAYVITVRATDNLGNVGTCSATVTVPHDQGQ